METSVPVVVQSLFGRWLAGNERMEKKTETTGIIGAIWGLEGIYCGYIEIMEKKIETTIMGYIGSTIRIHSFIPR